jgi:immunoglobulin-binding protein 1
LYIVIAIVNHRTQELLSSALADLQTLTRRINTLGLFSSNETFEELSIRSAAFMFVPYVSGDMQLRVRAIENEDRMAVVKKAAVSMIFLYVR